MGVTEFLCMNLIKSAIFVSMLQAIYKCKESHVK